MRVTNRKRFVSRELVALAAAQPQALADYSEQRYHDQIEAIADEVLGSGRHIIMLTGPSAAGKTTSAHKMATAIRARGRSATVLSLDDFFVGAGRYPKNADGTDDYECLEALDLPALHQCLQTLYTDGIAEAPIFDFTTQLPGGTQTVDCRGGVVVIEGLHALNPALTEGLPADAALCVYAGLREEYAAPDGSRCLATRDIRLARRLVRDLQFRGHEASFTLRLWPHVCQGEDRYIKPYKSRADLMLDTTHTYEVCLWSKLLAGVPADPTADAAQTRQFDALRARFAEFPALDSTFVPADSLLREFIGPQKA